jgi:4-amino-4-deoxy-L-arabinose transferase-like glycosyltransferase
VKTFILLSALSFIIGILLVWLETSFSPKKGVFKNPARLALGIYAIISLIFILFLFFNHIGFPLNLDLMEGTVLQHFQQAVEGKAIYPAPSPAYVPLAYNPLYYVISIPFSWLFGVSLFTLRLVAIMAAIGCGIIIYLVVKERTKSRWWGLMGLGIYAASYRAMDAYLDTAHSDSWLVFTALLGSYIIWKNRSKAWNLAGIVVLISSFWFKQHGALFVIGGLLYLTLREGWKRSWLYWLAGIVLGPALYIFLGPVVFGSYFHYFTWEVPSHWSSFNISTMSRILRYVIRFFPILSLAGFLSVLRLGFAKRLKIDIWETQFLMAALTGLMGALDAGSSDNIFISMSVFFIVVGTSGLHEWATRVPILNKYRLQMVALFMAFGVLVYNPTTVMTSPQARTRYGEFIGFLQSLNGSVYAPSLGQLQSGFVLYPAAHWVALEDMIRRPGFDTRNHPITRELLEPALSPNGPAFVLANRPLKSHPWIEFLEEYYELDSDLGDRFKALRVLPKRWDHGWPRYLYLHK